MSEFTPSDAELPHCEFDENVLLTECEKADQLKAALLKGDIQQFKSLIEGYRQEQQTGAGIPLASIDKILTRVMISLHSNVSYYAQQEYYHSGLTDEEMDKRRNVLSSLRALLDYMQKENIFFTEPTTENFYSYKETIPEDWGEMNATQKKIMQLDQRLTGRRSFQAGVIINGYLCKADNELYRQLLSRFSTEDLKRFVGRGHDYVSNELGPFRGQGDPVPRMIENRLQAAYAVLNNRKDSD